MIWFYFSIQITLLNGVSSWMSNGEGNIIANYDSYARNQLVSAILFAAQNKELFQLCKGRCWWQQWGWGNPERISSSVKGFRNLWILAKAAMLAVWILFNLSMSHISPLSTSINPETNSAANRLECRGEGSM